MTVVSFIMFIICVFNGVKTVGNIGRGVSIAAVTAFVLQIVSVIIAFRSRREKEIFMVLPNFALAFSGLGVLLWLYIYINGLMP